MKKSGRYKTNGLVEGRKEEYFAAVRAGVDGNYQPMEKIFSDVILLTLRFYEEK